MQKNILSFQINQTAYKLCDLYDSFMLSRRAQNFKAPTIQYYEWQLKYFFDWLIEHGIDEIGQISTSVIREYICERQQTHTQGGTHTTFAAIRAYFNWCWDEYEFDWPNPIKKVKCLQRPPTPIPGIPIDAISKIMTACDTGNFPERDRALISILIDTGIRRRECHDLRICDINPVDGVLNIVRGKNGKPRTCYLGKTARKYVRKYYKFLDNCSAESALWKTKTGEPLSLTGMIEIIRRVEKRAKLPEFFSFHDFRRCFALEAWRNGADINAVSELLGQSGIEVTKRYIASTEQDKRRIHAQVSPLDNLRK